MRLKPVIDVNVEEFGSVTVVSLASPRPAPPSDPVVRTCDICGEPKTRKANGHQWCRPCTLEAMRGRRSDTVYLCGHPRTPENTYSWKGTCDRCKTCTAAKKREWDHRNREHVQDLQRSRRRIRLAFDADFKERRNRQNRRSYAKTRAKIEAYDRFMGQTEPTEGDV